MMNHQTTGKTDPTARDDDKEEPASDAPGASGSPEPDSAAPVLHSEDDDALVDEDAPE